MGRSAVVPFVGLPCFTSHVTVVDLGHDMFEVVSSSGSVTLKGDKLGAYLSSLPESTKVEYSDELCLV